MNKRADDGLVGGTRELARVSGRESVAGPLQERLELVVEPGALVIRRGRVLRALRGGREEKRIPFGSLERVSMGLQGSATLVPKASAEVGPSRTLYGPAAKVAVAAWWACLGRDDAGLICAAATYVGPLGLKRSGLAIGGPAGVVFVSTGWASAVDDTIVRVPIDAIAGVERADSPAFVRLLTTGEGELLLDSAVASVDQVAAWLARTVPRMSRSPKVDDMSEQPVVWQIDDRGAWTADLSVVEGRLFVSARRDDGPRAWAPLGQVERIRLDVGSDRALCMLRFAGVVHTIRVSGARSLLVRLDELLRARAGDTGAPSLNMKYWKGLAGKHRVARIFQGAESELSLHEVSIRLSPEGMRLRGSVVPGVRDVPELSPGMRLRVSLPNGRGWQHFTATAARVLRELAEAGVAAGYELLLIPVADRLKMGDGRRSYHRVEDPEQTNFVLSRPRGMQTVWLDAALLDISAGGFAARLPYQPVIGERFSVELPTAEWLPNLEAEVIHIRSGAEPESWRVGFRLLGLTERHHSQLQREVLRRERDVLAERRRSIELQERPASHRELVWLAASK